MYYKSLGSKGTVYFYYCSIYLQLILLLKESACRAEECGLETTLPDIKTVLLMNPKFNAVLVSIGFLSLTQSLQAYSALHVEPQFLQQRRAMLRR